MIYTVFNLAGLFIQKKQGEKSISSTLNRVLYNPPDGGKCYFGVSIYRYSSILINRMIREDYCIYKNMFVRYKGVISNDLLGLAAIVLQAKRYLGTGNNGRIYLLFRSYNSLLIKIKSKKIGDYTLEMSIINYFKKIVKETELALKESYS